ncbi:MAG: sigma-70 family RNA polymerase sigma factor [Crocinitomicaceae bacterium]|jgi:RNA polymerase sigma-70 factor (ECF subfamily)|nr:sigma-70 family RNA polymerase sigma factor [Crocinitomicaceae bacterium]
MSLTKLDDRFLITEYINGNEKAFEVLMLRHKDRIYRSVYMKVKNPAFAEDIFQEVFIKIINTIKLGNYNEEGKFLPWALRIAQNMVIDHFRRNKKIKLISESSSKTDDFNIFHTLKLEEANIEERISKQELESQVVGMIEYLPDAQREILTMRLFQEMSFKDIAEQLDISINTALGRMRYALINMRKILSEKQVVVDL